MPPGQFGNDITAKDLDNDKWMLFNIDEDFSESDDVAAKNPAKLEELKQLWWAMASKYKVLPLDGQRRRTPGDARPQMSGPRNKYVYFPGTGEVEATNAVDMRNRSYSITADVEIPKGGRPGRVAGPAAAVSAATRSSSTRTRSCSSPTTTSALEEYKVISDEKVPAGKVTLAPGIPGHRAARLQGGQGHAGDRHAIRQRQASGPG